ncbi:MAG: septum formation initiator family protein [Candidatus Blackburnbacteria bacterium]|nr:septum formation initiator family protein [Candidatus Blackburnbacteria bacterium]
MKLPISLLKFFKGRILIVLVVLATISAVHSTTQLWGKGNAIEEAKKRLAEAEREQQVLLEAKKSINSPGFVEREAREKLGLARPDETIVVLPSEDVLKKLAPREDSEELFLEILPIWRRWLAFFVPELEKSLP